MYALSRWMSPNYTDGRSGRNIEKIVLHHAATTSFVGIGATFQNRSLRVSAHFGVAPGQVCQYVDINDTAWHCGNWDMNCKTIGIEHVNSTGAPEWQIADGTIKTGAELLTNLARRLGWSSLRYGQNVIYHDDVIKTYCPGMIRRANAGLRIIDLTNQMLSGGSVTDVREQEYAPPKLASQYPDGLWLYHDYVGNWRSAPSRNGAVMATYPAGTWVKMAGYVHGEKIDGDDRWLVSSRSHWYAHVSIFGDVYGLLELDSQPSSRAQTAESGLVAQQGTYKATDKMNIRRSPSLDGEVVAALNPGESVQYDGYVDTNGYRWISYIGYSGKRNYIARRNFNNGDIYGVCS